MKRLTPLFCLILIIAFFSCNTKKTKEDKTQKTVVEIPKDAIKIDYSGHIYFKLQLDSINGNFLYDTGADKLYFDSTFYAENNFTHKKQLNGYLPGVGSKVKKIKVIMDTVKAKIHTLLIKTTPTPIFNLKEIVGDFADGMIGKTLLKNLILKISYDKEYVQIYKTIKDVDTLGYQKIKLTTYRNRYYLPLAINIKDSLWIKGNFLLDLGNGGSINLTSQTAIKYNLKDKIKLKIPYYTKYGGVGGESKSFSFKANSLQIAGFQMNNVVMDYSIDKSGALSKRKYLGLLGNEILEHFDIIIDNINNYLYLKPNAKYGEPFHFSKKGFSYVDRSKTLGAWIVSGLYSNSNAEKAGLKIDDRILKINGINIASIHRKNREKIISQNDSIHLIIQRRNNPKLNIKFKLENITNTPDR